MVLHAYVIASFENNIYSIILLNIPNSAEHLSNPVITLPIQPINP